MSETPSPNGHAYKDLVLSALLRMEVDPSSIRDHYELHTGRYIEKVWKVVKWQESEITRYNVQMCLIDICELGPKAPPATLE